MILARIEELDDFHTCLTADDITRLSAFGAARIFALDLQEAEAVHELIRDKLLTRLTTLGVRTETLIKRS